MLAALNDDPDLAELIRAEYLTLAQLSHPGLERVLACGVETDGVPWFAAEFLDGLPLDAATAPLRGEPATGSATVGDYGALADVTAQISRGLPHVHARGLVDGDVTPANVLVTPHAERASASHHRAVLVDLGLSQPEHETLHPDTVRGTWGYMAPEMLLGQAPTRQSDLYAFGVTLHVAITGERPFLADTPDGLLDAQRAGLPRDFALHHPSVPLGFEAVLRRLLAPDPTERYDSANAVIRELNGYTGSDLREEPPPASRPEAWGRPRLVGRDTVRADLVARCTGPTDPAASPALVLTGPGGIGRTRLLEELQLRCELRGVHVARATGTARDARPFGALGELLAQLIERRQPGGEFLHRHGPVIRQLALSHDRAAMPEPGPDAVRDRAEQFTAAVLDLVGDDTVVWCCDDAQGYGGP